jgi:hypothetical protein
MPRWRQEFLRDDLRAGRADWIANPTLKRTCHSVPLPAVISFSVFHANLRQVA